MFAARTAIELDDNPRSIDGVFHPINRDTQHFIGIGTTPNSRSSLVRQGEQRRIGDGGKVPGAVSAKRHHSGASSLQHSCCA
ncbi:hypothetical protein BS17DRAFT_781546 [Gyrodon lividus]|nr:hypothetical protein BS17DRAFT_781546 [Gyrodon lividus]